MSKWLITTNQSKIDGRDESYVPTSRVHEFAGEYPTEDEINKVILFRGAILFMQKITSCTE